jgi:cell division protein FtsB
MDLCWEEEKLRWYDPASLQYLLTFDETEEARVSAERELDAAEERVRELEAEIRRLRD